MRLLILLIAGFNLTLPDYSWAKPVQLVHGVFLDDALVISYLFLMTVSGTLSQLVRNRKALQFSLLVAALGCLGVISAGVNAYSITDLGEAFRLFVLGFEVLLFAHWAARYGAPSVLRPFLIGTPAGGMVNLYFSITEPELMIGFLPTLRSQNGAGGMLAICIGLGSLLFYLRSSKKDTVVALASTAVSVVAVAMSFSKTSMSIGTFGLIAWLTVALKANRTPARRVLTLSLVFVALGVFFFAPTTSRTSLYSRSLVTSVYLKFSAIELSNKYSVGARYMYVFAVAEVMAAHPLVGVSYSGFYDAVIKTRAYKSGGMVDEDAESGRRGQSNPHNSFLYYASAGGIPGLLLSVAMYALFLLHFWRSLEPKRLGAIVLWGCFAFAYFIYGMTLPTLYDTEVLYVPATVVIAMLSRRAALFNRAGAEPIFTGLPSPSFAMV